MHFLNNNKKYKMKSTKKAMITINDKCLFYKKNLKKIIKKIKPDVRA